MYKQFSQSCGHAVVAAALACMSAVGCGNMDDVFPVALATTNSKQALALGQAYEINGSYGPDCVGRQGPWSLALAPLSSLTNPPLSVQQDNGSCVLSLESLRIGADSESASLFIATPSIALKGSYAATPSAFAAKPSGPAAFCGNAAILPDSSFHSNFVIQLVYSDSPSSVSISKRAEPLVPKEGELSLLGVPMPDYTASLDNLTVRTDLANVVTSVSGSVDLTAGSQTGESFMVLPQDLGPNPSYALVDATFAEGLARPLTGTQRSIAWDELELLGVSLASPVVRSIVIEHSLAGVRAYQIIKVTIGQ